MFQIIYRAAIGESFLLVGEAFCLADARAKRQMSGDIVVHKHSGETVASQDWLWDWERNNPDSYAYRHVVAAIDGS